MTMVATLSFRRSSAPGAGVAVVLGLAFLAVLAVSMDGGPTATFPNYVVDAGQYERLGLGTDRQVPALVLFDSVTKQPMPIGYGILSQDEIMDRVFQLTQVQPGSDF